MSNLTTVGLEQIVTLLAEGQYAAGLSKICVGTSNTAFDASQTDLLGSQQDEAATTAVTATDNFLTLEATFAAAAAAFAWNEVAIKDTDDLMLLRYAPQGGDPVIGTKPENVEWQVVVDVEFERA